MNSAEKRQHCRGCGNDFYNGEGAKECWSLKDAKLVTRYAIGFWTPMDTAKNIHEVVKCNCYHERGTVYMEAVPQHLQVEWNQLKRAKKENSGAR
jgi:hypothetical protein